VLAWGTTPWNPRWPQAAFLRHVAWALAWGTTPWNPRWPQAAFLRHAAWALAWGTGQSWKAATGGQAQTRFRSP
jgi:hypothetical protein